MSKVFKFILAVILRLTATLILSTAFKSALLKETVEDNTIYSLDQEKHRDLPIISKALHSQIPA